jgi:hypothetical protein
MRASLPLERLQRWMQEVVVHPGTIEEALSSPAAAAHAAGAAELILPSRTLEPAERIEIYQGMYVLRMAEALASDYPALQHFLGGHAFHELVRDYVQVHPSRSYTLNRLGDHLPDYLENARTLKQHAFLAELARLELAVAQVFDAPEVAPLSEAQIAEVPLEDWERAVLQPVPAFRLLTMRHNANDYAQAVKQETRPPRPRPGTSYVAIHRRAYAVYRHALPRAGHDLLQKLADGVALGDAVRTAMKRRGRERAQEQQYFRWFRDWVAGGVFASVRIPPR